MNDKSPKPPKHLSAEMKRFWRSLTAEFDFTPDMLLTLQTAAEQYDRMQQARAEIGQNGITVDGKRNPACDVEKVATGLFLRALRALNLDVVAPGEPFGRRK